jgi:hypothetical protein
MGGVELGGGMERVAFSMKNQIVTTKSFSFFILLHRIFYNRRAAQLRISSVKPVIAAIAPPQIPVSFPCP